MLPHSVLQLCAGIASLTVAVSACEVLASLAEYRCGGIYDLNANPVSSRLERWWMQWRRRPLRITWQAVRAVALIRLASAVPILVPGVPVGLLAGSATVAVISGWLLVRLAAGSREFGEQMAKTVLGAAALGWAGGSESTFEWATWFIAGQACLAYCAGGVFKLVSSTWRSGDALWKILESDQTGHPPLGRWFRHHPRWTAVLSWGMIVWEVTFPLVLIAPLWLLVPSLLIGIGLHLVLAFAMGLNTYLWAFVASYPAIVFVNYSLRAWLL